MIHLGPIKIDMPFFQAGLAGYSDTAMRLIARRHGCPYCITEAMLDQIIIRGGKGLAAAELSPLDHPIAGQLMGATPTDMATAAKVLLKFDYDVIDINLACPVKKIRKKSRGGHLMQDPDQAVAILDSVKQAVGNQVPCTVKLRRGTDDSPKALDDFYQIFQKVIELGYVAAVVHGRTVAQKYIGPAKWEFLKQLVDDYGQTPNFVIGGSGDIWQADDIFKMRQQTGVQLVSVARGCIGNPWIFTQARKRYEGDLNQAQQQPTITQQRQVLLEHFQLSAKQHGEKQTGMMMRKFGIKFSKHHHQEQQVKDAFIAVKSMADWQQVLDRYYHEK